MLQQTTLPSPLGNLILLADHTALLGVWFQDQNHLGAHYDLQTIPSGTNPILKQTQDWLTAYFAGVNPDPQTLPLVPAGTPYRQMVFDLLRQIPYGQTQSYKDLAQAFQQKTGQATSPRAIGGAIGHNPISLIIPCHRILGHDGSLTGYAGGLNRKIWLLDHEQISKS